VGERTQLHDVSHHAHDEEAHADRLADAQEFALVRYIMSFRQLQPSCSSLPGGRVMERTFATPRDETAAVLEEFTRHLQELLCLIHCGSVCGCGEVEVGVLWVWYRKCGEV